MEKPSENSEKVYSAKQDLGVLRDAVQSYFSAVNLTSAQTKRLEGLLLSAPASSLSLYERYPLVQFLQKNKIILFSNLATALAVASLFVFGSYFLSAGEPLSDSQDIISEVAVQPDASVMPADFNLEGDFESLQELINDSLPSTQMFTPNIPSQISKSYTAYEGRFFLVNGQQGVSINMKRSVAAPLDTHLGGTVDSHWNWSASPSTLYIVKLNKKSQAAFPQQKTLRKVFSATGKINRVYAWREGMYGYAVVQPPPSTPE